MSVARFIAERFNIICHCGVEQKKSHSPCRVKHRAKLAILAPLRLPMQ
jgi:hypothetical protein